MSSFRGFILQPTYRLESGVPVLHLYGRLEDGRSFLVRDRRRVPRFYVEKGDAARAREKGALRQVATDQVTLLGRPVVRIEVEAPADAPALRDRLARAGIATYEADVRFATRHLIDRGIRGSLEIRGEASDVPGLGLVFEDPELFPADWTPRLSVLSFDIETDPAARRLLAIGLHGCGASEVLLLTPPGRGCPDGARPFATEKELLAAFCARVRELDPDVLTGWNVVDFDLFVLDRLAFRHGVPLELGRGPGTLRLRAQGRRARVTRQATIPGRVVLDGILLLRGAFVRMDDYGLDAVARSVLGEGKTLAGHGRAEEILRLFEEDRERLVEYNRTDARLALEILEKLRLVELAVERSRLTGLPLDRVASSIAAFDFLYLSELGRRGIVAPSVRAGGRDRGAPGRRARPRAAPRPLHERGRAGLQEPLPEPHPHLRDRSAEPRPARGGPGGRRPHRGAERRRLRAEEGHPQRDPRRAPAAPRRGATRAATPSRATPSRS